MNKRLVIYGYVLVGMTIFYPALHSFFYADDFALLTIGRYSRNPLSFFIYNHFPGGIYYRPLGMSLWWLSFKLAGACPELQNLINILIHIGNSSILFCILNKFHAKIKLNGLLALIFLVHPLTISTAMWLSDRFDLLATLFIFLSLYTHLHFCRNESRLAYVLSVSACMLAALSKEIAYITPVLIMIISAEDCRGVARSWIQRLRIVAPYFGVVGVVAGVRNLVLRGATLQISSEQILNVIVIGFRQTIRLMPKYYSHFIHGIHWYSGLYILIIATTLVLVVLGLRTLSKPALVSWRIVSCGLAIILLTAILQAPVTYANLTYNSSDSFDIPDMVGSRFYYLSFAGFILVVQQFLSIPFRVPNMASMSNSIYILLIGQGIIFGLLSQSLCRNWSELTNGSLRNAADQAIMAIEQLPLPENNCRLYLLNSPADAPYFKEYSDSIIKAIASQNSRVIHCGIMTEIAPFYQVMLREDRRILKSEEQHNNSIIGQYGTSNIIYVYPNAPNISAIFDDPNALILRFDGQRFVKYTQQVKDGRLK